METKKYPSWVCNTCGLKASGGRSFISSTYHNGTCEVCMKMTAVTEPRDFYYPDCDKFFPEEAKK